jgi:hypothetical protein
VTRLPREFSASICILPKRPVSATSDWNRPLATIFESKPDHSGKYGSPVCLDVGFAELFQVWSTAANEAPEPIFYHVMNCLTNHAWINGGEVRLGLQRDTLYVAIGSNTDLFDPTLFRSLAEHDRFAGHFEPLLLLRELLQTFGRDP